MRKIAYYGEGGSNFGDFCVYVLCEWSLNELAKLKISCTSRVIYVDIYDF